MLTAIKDNQTVFIFDYTLSLLKEWSNQKQLLCPDCKNTVILKICNDKQTHFAHSSKDCSYPFREPESLEHEKGKLKIFQWLFLQFGKEHCEIEHSIDKTKQRADTFVHSHSYAFEFQCSPIQSDTWGKRHALYQEAEIVDIWILGYSMHTYQNKQNPFIHKLNSLERTLLKEYGHIIYYDVLTDYFVLLKPRHLHHNKLYGQEFYFAADECKMDNEKLRLSIKYDFFMNMQSKRQNISEKLRKQSIETDTYLKEIKKQSIGNQILASKKQINYIQYLLTKNNLTAPYKMHGLLRHEANAIIKDLLKQNEKKELR